MTYLVDFTLIALIVLIITLPSIGDRYHKWRGQGRIINNADFAEYLMDALHENPDLTERAIVHMYLNDEPLASDYQDSNSGSLEEGK